MAKHFDPGPLPVGTILCPSACSTIQASATHVFHVLIDVSKYPAWNSFCPSAELESNGNELLDRLPIGTQITEHVRMTPTSSLRKQKVVVTSFSAPDVGESSQTDVYKICWQAKGIPRSLLRADRTMEVVMTESGNTCEFRSWEFMAGPLAYAVKLMYGDTLQARFEDWAADLKSYAEHTWNEQQKDPLVPTKSGLDN